MNCCDNKYICNVEAPACYNMKGNIHSNNMVNNMNMQQMIEVDDIELFYPDTYKIIYPMVCSVCDMIQTPITKDLILMLTEDIYTELEKSMQIQIEVMSRQRNRYLNDLISILLIRELLNRRPNFKNMHGIAGMAGFQGMPFYY